MNSSLFTPRLFRARLTNCLCGVYRWIKPTLEGPFCRQAAGKRIAGSNGECLRKGKVHLTKGKSLSFTLKASFPVSTVLAVRINTATNVSMACLIPTNKHSMPNILSKSKVSLHVCTACLAAVDSSTPACVPIGITQ